MTERINRIKAFIKKGQPKDIQKEIDSKEHSRKWFWLGFNIALSHIDIQKIEGIISYPSDLEKFFDNIFVDQLLSMVKD